MSGVQHGVDVSWLHHSNANKEHLRTKKPPVKAPQAPSGVNGTSLEKSKREPVASAAPLEPAKTVPPPSTPTQIPSKSSSKRNLLHRASSDKLASSTSSSPEETKSSKRPGWISSLSSKFSASSPSTQTLSSQVAQTESPKQSQAATPKKQSQKESTRSASHEPAEVSEDLEPYVPQQPRSGNFFSSAIRRLSSTSQQTRPGQAALYGTTCPRKVLNVDPERERTPVKELDQRKLRRVAFNVDVEVVGVSRYAEDEEAVDPATKAKDKMIQARGEGAALKSPRAVEEQTGQRETTGDNPQRANSSGSVDDILESEMLAAAKQQELEAARKRHQEKKERKRREAEVAGKTSQEAAAPRSPSSPKASKTDAPHNKADISTKPHDRPTTDPLRMYRRCCQLREAPVLKRISEQLSRAKPEVEKTGVIENLDLNGSRLQYPDMVCLSDWLAIVPVRRLQLDNANLTDESVRIILAALLATRPPEPTKRKRARSSPTRLEKRAIVRTPGVIEKLSLRMNTKITSEGWRHICLFLNLSHSLRGIDLTMTPFPSSQSSVMAQGARDGPEKPQSNPGDLAHVLCQSLSTRPKASRLEELILSDCGLNTYAVSKIVDGICGSSVSRLGLATNHLDHEALEHISRYLQSGSCRGLDLGGNDFHEATTILTSVLKPDSPLWALSLAACNLDPSALSRLMPALLPLPDLRFLDLSHNQELFAATPNAVGTLRRYLPQLKAIRRVQLSDCALQPEQAIAIAEVLPDIRNMNHISFLDNPELDKLASATDPAVQEDSCAYYASLMWAVRLSKTMLAIDFVHPTSETNEVIQALDKQIDAYLFRNIDRYTSVDAVSAKDPYSVIPDKIQADKDVAVPDVLAHLVGHDPYSGTELVDDISVGPDQDYIVGGTGVVKAMSYVLSQKTADLRRGSGQATPTQGAQQDAGKVRARDMAKNMLSSARKIRCRLQVAIQKEQHQDDELMLRRLQFLDHTLKSMISRFESEIPECAVSEPVPPFSSMPYPFSGAAPGSPRPQTAGATFEPGPEAIDPTPDEETLPTADDESLGRSRSNSDGSTNVVNDDASAPGSRPARARPYSIDVSQLAALLNREESGFPPPNSRRTSTASLAARAQALEEGQMHKFGQKMRRDVLPPRGTDDHLHKTSSRDAAEPEHLQALRQRLEQMGGDEIRESVLDVGLEATVKKWGEYGEEMRRDSMPV